MKQVAIALRGLQLYAHSAHNLAKGPNFLEDHEFLGELYGTYEEEYDSIVERMIGEGDKTDIATICSFACELGEKPIASTDEAFATILDNEKVVCKEIKKAMKGASDGTQNLLQGIADESLTRQYKIQRRLGK